MKNPIELQTRSATLRLALAAATAFAILFGGARQARAQGAMQGYVATSYWIDYTRRSHGYADNVAILPRFGDESQWSRIRAVLMGGRKAHALYLVGDDRVHLFPTRVGVLGWGFNAGFAF